MFSRFAAPSTEVFGGVSPQGCAKDGARCQRGRMPLLATPAENHSAQEQSGSRVAFLLLTFLWPRKEK